MANNYDRKHEPVVGIDLGTTFSCIARWEGRHGKDFADTWIYQNLDKAKAVACGAALYATILDGCIDYFQYFQNEIKIDDTSLC